MRSLERNKLYFEAKDYFELGGSGVMKLSPEAAIDVCEESTRRDITVSIVEGGVWHNPGFEARVDCIWHGSHKEADQENIRENNRQALEFIEENKDDHDVFVVTTSRSDV